MLQTPPQHRVNWPGGLLCAHPWGRLTGAAESARPVGLSHKFRERARHCGAFQQAVLGVPRGRSSAHLPRRSLSLSAPRPLSCFIAKTGAIRHQHRPALTPRPPPCSSLFPSGPTHWVPTLSPTQSPLWAPGFSLRGWLPRQHAGRLGTALLRPPSSLRPLPLSQ